MATLDLGKIAFTWRGPYSPGATYARQDIVSYTGDSWICLVDDTIGIQPGMDPTKWELFAQGSLNIATAPGSLIYWNGIQLAALPPGAPGTSLKIDTISGLPVYGLPESRSGVKATAMPAGTSNMSYRRFGVIMQDGSIRMWGNSAQQQQGGGTTVARSFPVRVGFPSGFAGASKFWMSHNSCVRAIDKVGKFWGWGENGRGQLGTGNTTLQSVPYCASDNASGSIFGKVVTDVAMAYSTEGSTFMSTLVLCSDGTVHSVGYNAFGQLGLGAADVTDRTVFNAVTTLSNITKIYSGRERYTSNYALDNLGRLWCWGYNNEYQLGSGVTTQVNLPTLNAYFNSNAITLTDIYPCLYGAFGKTASGDLYYWGTPTYGNAGVGNATAKTTPILVNTNVKSVWTSMFDYQYTFIIKNDNTVWSAGYNGYGQLGNGNVTQQNSWVQITGLPTNITKMLLGGTASYGYTAFLTADGKVYTCGYNGNGQLCIGDVTARSTFQQVPIALRTVTDIQLAGYTSEGGLAFLLDDGQVLIGGYGGESQVPDPAAQSSYVPYPVVF